MFYCNDEETIEHLLQILNMPGLDAKAIILDKLREHRAAPQPQPLSRPRWRGFTDPPNHASLASCGAESCADSSRYGFGSFGEGQGPETTKARLGGRACLILGAWVGRNRNSNLTRFPEIVNSKTLFLRAGALGPSTAPATAGPTQP